MDEFDSTKVLYTEGNLLSQSFLVVSLQRGTACEALAVEWCWVSLQKSDFIPGECYGKGVGFKVGHPKSKVVYFHMEERVKKLIFIVSNLTKMQNLKSFRYFQG